MRARVHVRTQAQEPGPPRATAVIISLSFPHKLPFPDPPFLSASLPLRLVLRLNRADRTRVVRFLVLVTDNYRRSSFIILVFFPAAPGHQSYVK